MVIMGFDFKSQSDEIANSHLLPSIIGDQNGWGGWKIYGGFSFERVLERERKLLSRNTRDPIVGSLRDKKESCSTRRGLRVGTRFKEFPQTLRGMIFSLLGFYSHF